MIRAMQDKEVSVYSTPGNPLYLKIKGFSRKKVSVDMDFVVFYFLDFQGDLSDSFLGELPIKWRDDKESIQRFLAEYSKPVKSFRFGFFPRTQETKVFLSGNFEVCNEQIIFVASKMKLRVRKESIPPDIASKIILRKENEPVPKRHSCD